MPDFFNQVFLDNTVKDYFICAGIVVGIFIFKTVLSKIFANLIVRFVDNRKSNFDKVRFHNLVLSPIELFLIVLAIMIAFSRLNYPEAFKFNIYKSSFHDILEALSKAILIGSFIWLCNRLITYVAYLLHRKAVGTADKTDDQLILFFKDFLKVILWIIGVLMILKFAFGFQLTSVVTGLSIVGAALALAFRESLENLIASFIIFFDKPFTIGDLVKVENVTGNIERIGLRSTRIRTTEKTYTTVPNKKMVDSILDNQSLRSQRNVSLNLELSLETSVSQIINCIKDIEAILVQENILDANVFLSEIGKSSHIIHVEYFITMEISIKDFFKLREKINLAILEILSTETVKLNSPSNTVIVNPPEI